ncbi:MAG: hypothetical protein ACE5KH_03020 [Candidatus Geothermarchaeales archaeon]
MPWNKRPLHELVFTLVRKKKSLMMDELWRRLREESDEIGLSEVNSSLMKLEIWGRIDVTTEADNKRITIREE